MTTLLIITVIAVWLLAGYGGTLLMDVMWCKEFGHKYYSPQSANNMPKWIQIAMGPITLLATLIFGVIWTVTYIEEH